MWFLKSSLNLETSSLNVNLQVFWDKMGFLTALGSIWYIIYDYSEQQYSRAGLHELWHPGFLVARKSRENGEIKGKWREIDSQYCLILSPFPSSFSISSFSLHFLPLFPFPPSLCHILLQNVKYDTFVANVTKILTYAHCGNNSGSNSLRGSSASCAGLFWGMNNSWKDIKSILFDK